MASRGIPLPARDRRLHAVEENPRDDQTHPYHEAEEADHIDGGEPADAFLTTQSIRNRALRCLGQKRRYAILRPEGYSDIREWCPTDCRLHTEFV